MISYDFVALLRDFYLIWGPGALGPWGPGALDLPMAQGEDESDRDFDGFGPPAGPMLSHRSDPVGIYPAVWDENFTTRNQLSIDINRQGSSDFIRKPGYWGL